MILSERPYSAHEFLSTPINREAKPHLLNTSSNRNLSLLYPWLSLLYPWLKSFCLFDASSSGLQCHGQNTYALTHRHVGPRPKAREEERDRFLQSSARESDHHYIYSIVLHSYKSSDHIIGL